MAPELVAPVQVQSNRLVVRTLLDPHVAYSPARAVVERWEQIPAWLLDAWDQATEGNDTVRSAVTYTLAANVENLGLEAHSIAIEQPDEDEPDTAEDEPEDGE